MALALSLTIAAGRKKISLEEKSAGPDFHSLRRLGSQLWRYPMMNPTMNPLIRRSDFGHYMVVVLADPLLEHQLLLLPPEVPLSPKDPPTGASRLSEPVSSE